MGFKTTGGCGAILTSDEDLAAREKHLTATARVPKAKGFVHDEVGYNYRVPHLYAALGCAQVERLRDLLRRKRTLAEACLGAVAVGDVVLEPLGSRSNFWLNTMLLGRPDRELRGQVSDELNAVGIGPRGAWTLLQSVPMYRECPRMNLEVEESLNTQIVNPASSARLASVEGPT
jgi:perosamine synthetase